MSNQAIGILRRLEYLGHAYRKSEYGHQIHHCHWLLPKPPSLIRRSIRVLPKWLVRAPLSVWRQLSSNGPPPSIVNEGGVCNSAAEEENSFKFLPHTGHPQIQFMEVGDDYRAFSSQPCLCWMGEILAVASSIRKSNQS